MDFLFSGKGRVSRKAIWLVFLAVIVASIIAAVLDIVFLGTPLDSADSGPISIVLSLATIWPSIAISAKRFHDRGMSGWWVLWFILITIAALIPGGIIMAVQGQGALGLGAVVMVIGVAIPQIWQFIILMVQPGQTGSNEYGPNPLDRNG